MKVVVIGGGPAGMMAAVTAAQYGINEVTLIERNDFLGIKLNITGKGRCNLTNNCDMEVLMANTLTNSRFMYSSYSAFMPQDVMEFFEDLGVALKTERGNRVFPCSDRAKDVTQALKQKMADENVTVLRKRVHGIVAKDGAVTGVRLVDSVLSCDRVILATGGLSYPKTGSSGDGFKMAGELGHSVTKCSPSITSLICSGDTPKKLEGLSLRNISVTIEGSKGRVYNDFGELLFTKNGVSGPVILSGSAHCVSGEKYKLSIDLKPALDFETLDKRVLRDFEANINRDFANSLGGLLPLKMIDEVIARCGIDRHKKVNEITKAERQGLVNILKSFDLEIIDTGGYNEAVVTKGGIAVKEINPKTMESKLVSGLYFAGEIIDVDAYTGGFNLQIAWSTGRAAGMSQL